KNRLSNLAIKSDQISLGSVEEEYTIEASYPVIKKGIPKKSIDAINPVISAWAKERAESAQKDFLELVKNEIAVPEHATLSYVSQYKESHDFKFAPYINFKFDNYVYAGGAHGGTSITTLVFDARTGRQMKIEDIFIGEYLDQLSEAAFVEVKKLDPEFKIYTFTEDGLRPIAENFSAWEITPAGFRLTFGDYQIGPYTAGRPEITIAWKELSQVLKSEFIGTLNLAR
ncbi:MAG TPA: DUF3298 domain-containing protein, partial [Candidatus Paceibacterota bacterium]|nr:DUF3298 domain-containing protein [Candidatus Paceibacterota bacterium]